MTLQPRALSAAQRWVLDRLGPFTASRSFYLAGGTALALRLGHRRSVDFDWFCERPLNDPLALSQQLRDAGIPFVIDRFERGTLHGSISRVRVSFIEYRYAPLRALEAVGRSPFLIASLQDIACMKLAAIAQRGSRKDFVDIYALGRRLSLQGMIEDYKRRFRVRDAGHVVFALTFFDDAERHPMPRMLKPWSWPQIKAAIRRWVLELGSRRA